jgi:hypothetical protein
MPLDAWLSRERNPSWATLRMPYKINDKTVTMSTLLTLGRKVAKLLQCRCALAARAIVLYKPGGQFQLSDRDKVRNIAPQAKFFIEGKLTSASGGLGPIESERTVEKQERERIDKAFEAADSVDGAEVVEITYKSNSKVCVDFAEKVANHFGTVVAQSRNLKLFVVSLSDDGKRMLSQSRAEINHHNIVTVHKGKALTQARSEASPPPSPPPPAARL